jgi:hypothetical protein
MMHQTKARIAVASASLVRYAPHGAGPICAREMALMYGARKAGVMMSAPALSFALALVVRAALGLLGNQLLFWTIELDVKSLDRAGASMDAAMSAVSRKFQTAADVFSFSMEILFLMSRDGQCLRRYPIERIGFDSMYIRLDQTLRYKMIKRNDGIVGEHLSFAGLEQFAAPSRVRC